MIGRRAYRNLRSFTLAGRKTIEGALGAFSSARSPVGQWRDEVLFDQKALGFRRELGMHGFAKNSRFAPNAWAGGGVRRTFFGGHNAHLFVTTCIRGATRGGVRSVQRPEHLISLGAPLWVDVIAARVARPRDVRAIVDFAPLDARRLHEAELRSATGICAFEVKDLIEILV